MLTTRVEAIGEAIAYAAFYLVVATLLLTWIVQVALRPRTRQEWAEFGKITAFNMIVLRTVWTLRTGRTLSPEVAVVFWCIVFVLVAFFFVVLLDSWGPSLVRSTCQWCVEQWRWLIPAGIALALAAFVYALFF